MTLEELRDVGHRLKWPREKMQQAERNYRRFGLIDSLRPKEPTPEAKERKPRERLNPYEQRDAEIREQLEAMGEEVAGEFGDGSEMLELVAIARRTTAPGGGSWFE